MAEPIKVFVSYSWSVEENTGIVDQLEALCQKRNIELIRDKTELKHRESISKFMSRLSRADHVITIFSDRYFQSEYCMYELMRIQERGNFAERIYPILAENLKLSDQATRRTYITFWKNRVAEEENEIRSLEPGTAPEQHEKLNVYKQIALKIDQIMAKVGDMKITPLDQLKTEEFSQVLDLIHPVVSVNKGNTHFKNTVPDSQFLKEVKANITKELSSPEVKVFVDVLRAELNKVLENLGKPETKVTGNEASSLTGGLIWALIHGGQEVPVITKVLLNAFMHCFDKRGSKYGVAQAHQAYIVDTVEQILGWLVLISIDEARLSALAPKDEYKGGLYFLLPIKTWGGVEVIVSRQYQRRANLKVSGSDVGGEHMVRVYSEQHSWKDEETVECLMLNLWNQVFPEESQETNLTENQIKTLNATLLHRRENEWDPEHHFVAVECDTGTFDEAHKNTYKKLLEKLDHLTLVRFGISGQDVVFYTSEHFLMSAISEFLNRTNKILVQYCKSS